MRKADDIVFYILMIALAAVIIVMIVPGVLYLTTDKKATVDLAASTADPAFRSWAASNNYELIGVEATIRQRGIIKVKIKQPDKE